MAFVAKEHSFASFCSCRLLHRHPDPHYDSLCLYLSFYNYLFDFYVVAFVRLQVVPELTFCRLCGHRVCHFFYRRVFCRHGYHFDKHRVFRHVCHLYDHRGGHHVCHRGVVFLVFHHAPVFRIYLFSPCVPVLPVFQIFPVSLDAPVFRHVQVFLYVFPLQPAQQLVQPVFLSAFPLVVQPAFQSAFQLVFLPVLPFLELLPLPSASVLPVSLCLDLVLPVDHKKILVLVHLDHPV